tara:strand:- start:275 stop:493 length:219 start_codon:yes stop_codon:yes gene_type:complete
MSKIVFVPLTDEMVFDRPDLITGPITTYQPAIPNNSIQNVSTNESPISVGTYLKGDLVNGLDVVYVGDKPAR